MPFQSDPLRRALRALLPSVLLLTACRPASPARLAAALPDSATVKSDIAYLAADRLDGRATGTAGNDSAAAYLSRRYASMGLTATAQTFTAHVPVRGGTPLALAAQNVYAIVPGSDPSLKNEYLILGAHFDHLGRSTTGALDPEAGAVIRNGADDNASGTAAVLTLARRFARQPARRSIVFANFTGEELGLLGSTWFADHPPVPLDRVQAMLNFDMVGRLRNDKLIVYGVATATELKPLVDSANAGLGLKISAVGDGFGPSDQSSFYAKNIPVLHFFTDLHEEYHRAADKAETTNAAGEVRVIDLAERITRSLADRSARLAFVRSTTTQAARGSSSERQGSGVYLGSIPDMGAGDVVGMKLSGVRAGTPADLGGLKAGDVIVEFGGTPVKDIYSYTDALGAFKPGDVVKIVVLRGSERLTLTVTLGKRAG